MPTAFLSTGEQEMPYRLPSEGRSTQPSSHEAHSHSRFFFSARFCFRYGLAFDAGDRHYAG